jgi:maleate cis-trans isomerase
MQAAASGVDGIWSSAARIALVVPGDSQVDDEFWRLLAPHAIPLVSRTTGADPQQMMRPGMAGAHTAALARSSDLEVAADRLRATDPVAAAYVDTSISFIRGPGGDLDIARRIESFLGVPTVATSTAVVHACRALGVARLAVLTVYLDEINAAIPTFFEPQGIRIARMEGLDTRMEAGARSQELGRMSPGELVRAGQAIDGAGIDAVFIPCTAVRTLDAIEPLEEAIGKPVITAIQATIWRVSRLAGLAHDAPQGGRLFERSPA